MGVKQYHVLVIVVLKVALTGAYECKMCPMDWDTFSVGPIAARDSWFVAPGETCNTVYLDADDATRCAQIINDYADVCCYEGAGTQAPQPPTPSEPVGTEPVCDLCFDHQYPRSPNTFINSYYASGTCGQLYHKGRNQNIANAVCYPLQVFAQEPCGCNQPAPSPTPPSGTPSNGTPSSGTPSNGSPTSSTTSFRTRPLSLLFLVVLLLGL